MKELKCPDPIVQCDNPNILATLRSDGKQNMLFIMNLFSSPMKASIKVNLKNSQAIESGIHNLNPMEIKTLKL